MSVPRLEPAGRRDSAVRAALVGLRAAWRAPSLVAHDVAALLVSPALRVERTAASEAVNLSVGVAHRALALLARVWPARWRAACLHRSVAECVVLRAYGLPARVVLGVGN